MIPQFHREYDEWLIKIHTIYLKCDIYIKIVCECKRQSLIFFKTSKGKSFVISLINMF